MGIGDQLESGGALTHNGSAIFQTRKWRICLKTAKNTNECFASLRLCAFAHLFFVDPIARNRMTPQTQSSSRNGRKNLSHSGEPIFGLASTTIHKKTTRKGAKAQSRKALVSVFVAACFLGIIAFPISSSAQANDEETEPAQVEESTQPDSDGTPVHLGLELLTDVPIEIGMRIAVEVSEIFRASVTLGVLPGPYVDLINAVVIAFDGYNDATADLITQALNNSLILRFNAGLRPWADLGLYFDIGYTLVTLGGGVAGEDLFAAVTGITPPTNLTGDEHPYDVASTLHLVGFEVGWQWVFAQSWTVRTALGAAFTVASNTTVEADFDPRFPSLVEDFTAFSEAYLDDVYTSYVHTPVICVSVGYRFF
ncbi:MAG: hypothetical protein KJ597_07575 [Nanoarchaeota archaeon]|nr:hypothetical protein [Nanoarchaeota archaeon]